MAANEKVHYATSWTSYGDKIFRPGEQMTGRVDPDVIRHAEASGLTTTSHAEAERAKGAEMERRRDVERQQQSRAERRENAE
jgi:uncharacterized protein YaiL (DUF2058 family)